MYPGGWGEKIRYNLDIFLRISVCVLKDLRCTKMSKLYRFHSRGNSSSYLYPVTYKLHIIVTEMVVR